MPRTQPSIGDVTHGWHPDEQRWLDKFRATLKANYGDVVEQALLFGSRARGDWRPESDIDVMVVVKDEAAESEDAVTEMAFEVLCKAECWEAVPVVLTSTASEWAEGLETGFAFHEAVKSEGIQLL